MVRIEVGGRLGSRSTVTDSVGVMVSGTVVIKFTVGVGLRVTGFFMLPQVLLLQGRLSVLLRVNVRDIWKVKVTSGVGVRLSFRVT